MSYIQELFSNIYVLICLSAIVAWGLSHRMFPVIVYIAHKKRLTDAPEARKSHTTAVPNLGGVGLFFAFSLTMILFGMSTAMDRPELIQLLSVLGATIILLFMGIKDDLVLLSPRKKLMGQIIAAAVVIFMTDFRIMSFDGLLGIGELPYIVSVVFTFFVFLLVVNAYNLIDGIDGLAGAIGLIANLTFGIFFVLNEQLFLALVSFTLIGAVIGFLGFNFSKTHKLFMGDSGSLFLGYLLAYQGIAFLGVNEGASVIFVIAKAPILLLAVLSFPLLDTLRVFILRAIEGRSPLSADRNHIHHRLLDLGLTHLQATLYITLSNVVLIGLVLAMGDIYINVQLFITVFVGLVLYLFPFLKVFEKEMGLEVVKTIPDQETNMEQVLANEGPTQQSKPSFTPPLENGVANTEIATVKELMAEERKTEIKKSQRQKISSKKPAIFKKSQRTKMPHKRTAD